MEDLRMYLSWSVSQSANLNWHPTRGGGMEHPEAKPLTPSPLLPPPSC